MFENFRLSQKTEKTIMNLILDFFDLPLNLAFWHLRE